MKFVITIPVIEPKSAGVRALLYLHDMLHFAGYESEINGDLGPDDIMVYPDLVRGNPANAKRVVRYMLYFASSQYFQGDRIPATDCVIVYSFDYFKDVAAHYDGDLPADNVIQMPTIEPGLFHVEQKTVEAVLYRGKQTTKEAPLQAMPEITRENMSREGCAKLLRSAKNLYTLDHHSAIITEAQMCGCNVWLVKDQHNFTLAELPGDLDLFVQQPERDVDKARMFANIALSFFSIDKVYSKG